MLIYFFVQKQRFTKKIISMTRFLSVINLDKPTGAITNAFFVRSKKKKEPRSRLVRVR